jgi:hypothetical protein
MASAAAGNNPAQSMEFTFTLTSAPVEYSRVEYRFPENEYYLNVTYGKVDYLLRNYSINSIDVAKELLEHKVYGSKRSSGNVSRSTGLLRLRTDCPNASGRPVYFTQGVGEQITLRVVDLVAVADAPLDFRCASFSIQSPRRHVTYSEFTFNSYNLIESMRCSEASGAAVGTGRGGGGARSAPFGAAVGGAGGGGASSASSPSTPGLTPASEKLKQMLKTTVMEDGTRFLFENEFLADAEPYFTVTVRPPGVSPKDTVYKIMLNDLSIQKIFAMSDTTPERFDALQAILAKFRPRANNSGRRSSRKQRKSRRTNRNAPR